MSKNTSFNSKSSSAQKAIIEDFQEAVDQQVDLHSVFSNTNLQAKAALPVITRANIDKRTFKNNRTEAQKAADARKRLEKFTRENNRNGESPSASAGNGNTVNNFHTNNYYINNYFIITR